MKCQVLPIELKLKRDFIVAGGRRCLKRNFIFIIEETGLGEAAGSVHYGATESEIENDLNRAASQLAGYVVDNGFEGVNSMEAELCAPARCALATARHDWSARKQRIPLYEALGLEKPQSKPTSITASVGDARAVEDYVKAGFKHIKVKMSGDYETNRALIEAINGNRDVLFRIDANGSWNGSEARTTIGLLNSDRVELIEQPFVPEAVEDWKRLRDFSPIPLFMDESIVDAADVKRVAGYVDGVNIKIQKSGSLDTASEALKTARGLGLKTMLGCMIESSVGIAAAWHLSSLADYLDLDGRLLIENDPFAGLTYDKGTIEISNPFGHGVAFAR